MSSVNILEYHWVDVSEFWHCYFAISKFKFIGFPYKHRFQTVFLNLAIWSLWTSRCATGFIQPVSLHNLPGVSFCLANKTCLVPVTICTWWERLPDRPTGSSSVDGAGLTVPGVSKYTFRFWITFSPTPWTSDTSVHDSKGLTFRACTIWAIVSLGKLGKTVYNCSLEAMFKFKRLDCNCRLWSACWAFFASVISL